MKPVKTPSFFCQGDRCAGLERSQGHFERLLTEDKNSHSRPACGDWCWSENCTPSPSVGSLQRSAPVYLSVHPGIKESTVPRNCLKQRTQQIQQHLNITVTVDSDLRIEKRIRSEIFFQLWATVRTEGRVTRWWRGRTLGVFSFGDVSQGNDPGSSSSTIVFPIPPPTVINLTHM